jgi:hypothetical protein
VFAVPVALLYAQGRVSAPTLFFGVLDLVLGALFFVSWRRVGALTAQAA